MDTTAIGGCAPEAAICARGIARDFEAGQTTIRVLHGIDTDIRPGELTYIVGESGSGKTTLISIMCGILYPTEGEVKVFGTDIYKLSDTELVNFRLRNIGFIFQQYNLIPTLSSRENILLPLTLAGEKEDKAWFDTIVETVGLGNRLDNLPSQLSGGQQQRVAVARALVPKPDIVFADEPTGALDSRTGMEILAFMRKAVDESGQTIVMVTHDPHAASYANSVLFLADGQIIDQMQSPTTDRVLDRMKQFEG